MSSLSDLIMKNGMPNAHTWRTLLMNYSHKGYLQQLGILEAMHDQGIIPAAPHYNIVIEGLSGAQKMKAAWLKCWIEA